MTDNKAHLPVHPGELLREEFLEPMGMTAYELAKGIGVPAPRVYDIVREKRGISADTALRLSRYFGMSERYWINAQAYYDLQVARDKANERIEKQVVPRGRSSLRGSEQTSEVREKRLKRHAALGRQQAEWRVAGKWMEKFVSGEAVAQDISALVSDDMPEPEKDDWALLVEDVEQTLLSNELQFPRGSDPEEFNIMWLKLEESDDPQRTLEIVQQALRTARAVEEAVQDKQTSFEAIPKRYYDDPTARRRIETLRVALQQYEKEAVGAIRELLNVYGEAKRRLDEQLAEVREEGNRLFTLVRLGKSWNL